MKWLNPKTYLDILIGKVIVSKVLAKVVKHGATALAGLIVGAMSSPWFIENVAPVTDAMGIEVSEKGLEAGLVIVLSGIAGAILNYVKHRSK